MADGDLVPLPDVSDRDGAFGFLAGVVLNQNISGRQAWRGVQRLGERGFASAADVCDGGEAGLLAAIQRSPVVHPFAGAMAEAIWSAAASVTTDYDGDARRIWQTATSHGELVDRLMAFRRIGAHKAHVAVYLLAEVYSAVPGSYGSTGRIRALCPSVVDMLSAESWAIRRREHAGTTGPDL